MQTYKPTYPCIRRATDQDYHAIHRIWMQDHIIKWMSFTKQDAETFQERYNYMARTSDIYVMLDQDENGIEKIVGVRRIKFIKDDQDKDYMAEFCSMGIDKAACGRGYGKIFTEKFEEIARERGVARVQLTQSGGNLPAFKISDTNGYTEEALFPDWLERQGQNGHSYFLIERYIYKIIDAELLPNGSKAPKNNLQYKAKLPILNDQTTEANYCVKLGDNQLTVYLNDKVILTTAYFPDTTVVKHIGFLENVTLYSEDELECQGALRAMLTFLLQEKRVAKIEFFTADEKVISACQELGFWMRGQRYASAKKDGVYYNELGFEYSFFTLDKAKELVQSYSEVANKNELLQALENCSQVINQLKQDQVCDSLGQSYLEYFIYQVVRDTLPLNQIVSLKNDAWRDIIIHLPENLQVQIKNLIEILAVSRVNYPYGIGSKEVENKAQKTSENNKAPVPKAANSDFFNTLSLKNQSPEKTEQTEKTFAYTNG